MIGAILSAAGAVAGLIGAAIPNREITKEFKVYSPDISSIANAGLFNQAVDLGEQTVTEKEIETPMAKQILGYVSQGLGAGGSIAGAAETQKMLKA